MQSPETLAVILQDLRGYFLSRLTFYRKKQPRVQCVVFLIKKTTA